MKGVLSAMRFYVAGIFGLVFSLINPLQSVAQQSEPSGCTYSFACNYDPEAFVDDGSCTLPDFGYDCAGNCLLDLNANGICDLEEVVGCTNIDAINFDATATLDNGTCMVTCKGDFNNDGTINVNDLLGFLAAFGNECEGAGCMDPAGCNYDPNATFNLDFCEYPALYFNCDGTPVNDADGDGVPDELEVLGCTNAEACNYDALATDDNGSCELPAEFFNCDGTPLNDTDGDGIPNELEVAGCTNPEACNYDALATDDNGGCELPAEFFNCEGAPINDADGDGIPDELEVAGCTNPEACNYDALATDDNGSCELPAEFFNCEGAPINDTDGDGIPNELEVPGCTNSAATNYNPAATDDDGSCILGIQGDAHTCGAANVHNPDLVYGSVTDIDGNTYRTIVIGQQEWMAENLNVSRYSNGDLIPNITDNGQWQSSTNAAWCDYNNSVAAECPYGKLYKWYVTVDNRNVCPAGWHVPSDQEWFVLMNFLGGEPIAGGKLKSMNYFYGPNFGATNETGFSGIGGGIRSNYGNFADSGWAGYYWSSTENGSSGTTNAWARMLEKDNSYLSRIWWPKPFGLSIRCIKD